MEPLYTTTASLNFSHPCHFCGADTHVIDGQRQPHVCRIDLDAHWGASMTAAYILTCKHCRRPISDNLIGPVHMEGGYRGKQRCDPDDSGLPYGYNAGRIDSECVAPCLGAGKARP